MARPTLASLNPTNGILLVARLDGPSAEIARGLVDKAVQAERDGLWGRAYFDARGIAQVGHELLFWATNGFSAPPKPPGSLDLKRRLTTSPAHFPQVFP